MLKKRHLIFALFAFVFTAVFMSAAEKELVVLASRHSPESIELAKGYCRARSIPESRILLIDLKEAVNVSRKDYNDKIAQPLFDFLCSEKLVDVSGNPPGFEEALVTGVRIDYVVICRPLPYRITGTPKADGQKGNIGDSASVDSELSMLLRGKYEMKGPQRNPLFSPDTKTGMHKVLSILPVARLDGPKYEHAHNMYRQAILAEQNGLRGRAYIDMDKSFKYPEGNKWLDNAGKILEKMGFDTSRDAAPRLMTFQDRLDGLIFYFGWYISSSVGYFRDPEFQMAPGASALHIYSFSAQNLRVVYQWIASFASNGSSAAFGTIDEPFLAGFYRPDVYCLHLARGLEAGEAALYSMPALSWKGMYLGDPLYKPFKIGLDEQMRRIDDGKTDALSQYSVIRKMNLTDGKDGRDAAFALGKKYADKLSENFALNWKLSQYCQEKENDGDALKYARAALAGAKKEISSYGLVFEILKYMDSRNLKSETLPEYIYLLESKWDGHNDYLKSMLTVLLSKVDFPEDLKAKYEAKLLELNPPPKPKN